MSKKQTAKSCELRAVFGYSVNQWGNYTNEQ